MKNLIAFCLLGLPIAPTAAFASKLVCFDALAPLETASSSVDIVDGVGSLSLRETDDYTITVECNNVDNISILASIDGVFVQSTGKEFSKLLLTSEGEVLIDLTCHYEQ